MKKEIVSVTAIDERDMTKAVIARADEAISELESQLSAANHRMQNAVQELKSIPEDRARRQAEYGKAKESATHLRDRLGHAQAMLRLYDGTPLARAHEEAADALHAELASAESVLREIEQTVNERGFSSKAREQELQALIDNLTPLIVSLQTELKHMRTGREQAFQELGKQEYQAILDEKQAKVERIAEMQSQLASAERELLDWSQEQLRTFTAWRELRQQLRQQLPQEDSHTRVLGA
jgi:septation ring formation regulator EzrA